MSNLLYNESPLVVNPPLACLIGLNEAIIVQQVNYWLINARKVNDPAKFKDGRWWTYGSAKEWRDKNFPFWSVPTTRRTLASLEKSGILLRRDDADPKAKGGCRVWYSIDYQKLASLEKGDEKEGVDHTTMIKLDIPYDQVDHTFTENITETSSSKNFTNTPTAVGGGAVITPAMPEDAPKSKRAKSRPKGDAVPMALMNPMKEAIAAAFGWDWNGDDPMTAEEIGQIQKVARSLCKANVKPSQIPSLHAFIQARYDNPGPMALSTNVSKWRAAQRTSAPPSATPDLAIKDAYKRARRDCRHCGGNGVVLDSAGASALCACVAVLA